jgi:proline racemase
VFGVLFWHKDRFSTACSHGAMALGAWAVKSGRVAADPSDVTEVAIDVPSGRVTARVRTAGASRTRTRRAWRVGVSQDQVFDQDVADFG